MRISCILAAYDYLSSIVLHLLILSTIAFERRLLRQRQGRVADLALSRNRLRILRGGAVDFPERLRQLLRLRLYVRERLGLAHGLYYLDQCGQRDVPLRDSLARLGDSL